jgi:hypothetical protein
MAGVPGLNGIVIKSHGGSCGRLRRAIDIGYDMVRHELLAKSARRSATARCHPPGRPGDAGCIVSVACGRARLGAICPGGFQQRLSRMVDTPTNGSRSARDSRAPYCGKARLRRMAALRAARSQQPAPTPIHRPDRACDSTPDNTFPASAVRASRPRGFPTAPPSIASGLLGLHMGWRQRRPAQVEHSSARW